MPRLLAASLAASLLAACTAAPTEIPSLPAASARSEPRVEELRTEMADVATAQRSADRRLANALTAVRQLSSLVAGLRDPRAVDASRRSWRRVAAAMATAEPAGVRPYLFKLAFAVDRARSTLDRVRDAFGWGFEVRYLTAEDDMLVAIRGYAEAADRLAQALGRHWPVYRQLQGRTAAFVERRWHYRTPREATDAYELVIQPLLDDLTRAQAGIETARQRRDAAAAEVNARAVVATEVWVSRGAATPPD